jgi:hypothetical protein
MFFTRNLNPGGETPAATARIDFLTACFVFLQRQARAEMMETFDIRDLPAEKLVKPGVFKQHTKNFPLPFKMSMVSIMGLSEAQKEDLLAAKRSMTIEFEAIISERKRSTAELKKVNILPPLPSPSPSQRPPALASRSQLWMQTTFECEAIILREWIPLRSSNR